MGVGAADARATLQLKNISGVSSASGTVGPGGQELALQSPAGPGSSRDSATLNRPSTSVCLRHRLPAGGRWAGTQRRGGIGRGPQQGERFLSGPLRVDRRRRPRPRALIRIEGDDAFKALSSSPIRKVPF